METPTLYEADIISGAEAERLNTLETTIERGLYTFVDVGNALLEIRDSRLYRTTHGTFEEYCRERWGFERRRVYQLMEAAQVVGNLDVQNFTQRESHVAPLARLDPPDQRVVWEKAVETAPNGKVTAAHVQRTVDEFRPRYPLTAANHAVSESPDYDGDEWYTPATYIEAARSVMGGIDLDPASSAEAQRLVQAGKWYGKQDDGLSLPWAGCVWLNPPYSMPLIRQFVTKLIDEYECGNVTEAIILTNNSSDTAWFHDLLSRYPACFTRGRVQFWRPGHDNFGARQGQVLFFLGSDPAKFAEVFSTLGQVVKRI